jgi:ribosome-associated translation inhibitor RaiA
MTMIEIRGIRRDAALWERVATRLTEAVEPLHVKPFSIHAAFVDDNGPKGGPALRCALTVTLPARPALRAEASAETARLAFDSAMPALERKIERYRERARDLRRRPKKYYAARRALAG